MKDYSSGLHESFEIYMALVDFISHKIAPFALPDLLMNSERPRYCLVSALASLGQ